MSHRRSVFFAVSAVTHRVMAIMRCASLPNDHRETCKGPFGDTFMTRVNVGKVHVLTQASIS